MEYGVEIVLNQPSDFNLPYSVFLLTSGDTRGLGILLGVCACAIGLCGNALM